MHLLSPYICAFIDMMSQMYLLICISLSSSIINLFCRKLHDPGSIHSLFLNYSYWPIQFMFVRLSKCQGLLYSSSPFQVQSMPFFLSWSYVHSNITLLVTVTTDIACLSCVLFYLHTLAIQLSVNKPPHYKVTVFMFVLLIQIADLYVYILIYIHKYNLCNATAFIMFHSKLT